MRRIIATAVLALLASVECASVARGDLILAPTLNIRDDQAGADVSDPAGLYDAVGFLQAPGFAASGTLIGPNWVLTAAHVVGSGSANQYSFKIGGQTYTGAEIFREPTWAGDLFAGNDIALLRLTAAVTNVVPAALFDGSFSELGQIGAMVGYGSRGTGSAPGSLPGAGALQIGRNIIDATGDMIDQGADPPFNERILFTDFDDPANPAESFFGLTTAIDLESNVAGGDSGGALFANFGSGNVLVGVISFLAYGDGSVNGDYGDLSGFTRVADHLAFIESRSGITPASVPEPSSWLLLGTVFAICILSRSRRMTSLFLLGRRRSA